MQNTTQNTNGAQCQSGFTAQRTINGFDMNSAMPTNKHYSPAMRNANGSFHTQQGPSQAQLHMMYGPQMANGNGGNPTMNGRVQFSSAVNQQPGAQFKVAHRQQLPQNYQVPQSHQATQNYQGSQIYQSAPIEIPQAYQHGGAFITTTHYISYENPDAWTNNTPDVHPAQPSDAGTTESSQPQLGPETLQQFEDRVAGLVEEKATTFRCHIQNNEADLARHEAAVWKAKRKGDKFEDKSEGYPTTEAGLSALKQRIFDALLHIDGDQDPASDTDIADCLALRTIQGLSDLEIEIVAQKLVVSTTGIITLNIAN